MSAGASPWRTISVALTASTSGYTTGLSSASAQTKAFGRQVAITTDQSTAKWRSFSKGATVGVALFATALAASAREAINWESAFAGVRKTVTATEAEYSQLSDTLLAMARRMPATRTEIAGVAEAAGQLGIAKEDIASFTEIAIGLGTATNLSSDEAATGLARLSNIMGTSAQDFDRLGSTLVDLGNKGASTESEILQMATRMAGAGKLVGLTEANILSLANALSSLGVQSELGSGVTTRFLTKMYSAVQEGGKSLAPWAAAARVSASEFAKAYSTEPVKALEMVVAGMSKTKAEGGNVVALLADLGLKGTQNTQVLTALAGGYDVLHQSILDGNQAWTENVALQREVDERYKTAASQLAIFRNQVTDVMRIVGAQLIPVMLASVDGFRAFARWAADAGSEVGARLAPAFADFVSAGRNVADALDKMWDSGEPVLKLLVGLSAAVVIGGIKILADVLEHLTGFLADHADVVLAASAAWVAYRASMVASSAWTATAAGVQAVASGVTYLTGAITALAATRGISTLAASIEVLKASFAAATAGAAGLALAVGAITAAVALGYIEYRKWQAAGRDMADDKIVAPLRAQAKAAGGTAAAYADVAVKAASAARALNTNKPERWKLWDADQRAELEAGAAESQKFADEALIASSRITVGMSSLQATTGMTEARLVAWAKSMDIDLLPALAAGRVNLGELSGKVIEASTAADNATPATEKYAAAMTTFGDETASAEDKLKAWKDTVDTVFGVNKDIFDATTAWSGALADLTKTMKENYLGGLDQMTEAGRKNRDALSGAAEKGFALAEAYQAIGDDNSAAYTIGSIRDSLFEAGRAAGFSDDQMSDYLATLGLTPEQIETLIKATIDPDGLAAANEALAVLARDRTAVITAIVKGQSAPELNDYHYKDRWGGVHEHARWGRIPAHVTNQPTILYGERDTGGEAMVPRKGNYGRSMSILGTAASWYGASVVPAGAAGGSSARLNRIEAALESLAARPAVTGPLVQVNPAQGMSERRIGEVASEQTAKALAGVGGHR